uniref:Uncharacterized protein n=1 Tax=Alexandrium catenella TaxID=2925 RepID=A0A7S1W915_ALECA
MAFSSLMSGKLRPTKWEQALDMLAPEIMLKGLGRPWQLYAAHGAIFAANYGGFLAFIRRDLLKLLFGRCCGQSTKGAGTPEAEEEERQARRSLASTLFVKFLVWQHLAEAIGCRQGPIGGHFGAPNNWRYRLSLGTLKYPLLPFMGKKRNLVDLLVHILFFVAGGAFLKSREYGTRSIRLLCACDAWICCSDLSQFFASTGHAYFSMLFSACFPENQGRLAGMQTALIIQWFFSGIGKLGPWFTYVNGPFMLQSRLLAGQTWLHNLLVKSPTDLRPTTLGAIVAHTAAAVEYVGPLALMFPRSPPRQAPPPPAAPAEGSEAAAPSEEAVVAAGRDRVAKASIWFGLSGLVAMHTYILAMPAPFDVYSWNMCFGLSAAYLFYFARFGFDHEGAGTMHRGLAAYLAGEVALCWYGQFFPDKVGYYLSHRYWAGNWVQTLFFVRKDAGHKLGRVKSFSASPQIWRSLEPLGMASGLCNMAYLWLANLNMKASVGLIFQGVKLAGGPTAEYSDYFPIGLTQWCCGEFRDALYALPLLPAMQEQLGFESGECFMVRLGAFGMFQDTATWGIYDLKDGLIKGGLLSVSALNRMNSFPSQSISALADH